MKIYIDRDKAIEAIEQEFGGDTSPECIRAKEAINSVEFADVAPLGYEHYKKRYIEESGRYDLECSGCGFRIVVDKCDILFARYCNYCGARIIEDD